MTRARSALTILCASVVVGCSPSPPSPSPSSSSTETSASALATPATSAVILPSGLPTPSSTLAPSPPPSAAGLRWTKTETNLPIGVAHAGVTALAMRPGNPPTYVAISADHRVWLSTDGVRWRRGGELPPAEGGTYWSVRQLLVVNSTLVAFGFSAMLADGGFDGPYSGIVAGYVWASNDDGETWKRTRLDGFSIGDVILDQDRLVGIGGVTKQYTPTIATSADGESWSRITIADDPWPGDPMHFRWHSVASLAGRPETGYLVAVNRVNATQLDCGAAPVANVWRSTDLQHWQPGPTFGCVYVDLIGGPVDDLAMNWTYSQTSDVIDVRGWVSADGLAWQGIAQPPGPLRWFGSLAIAPDGTFLVIGDGIWESVDGDHWFLSAPAKSLNVEVFAGDLAIACGNDGCSSLRLR